MIPHACRLMSHTSMNDSSREQEGKKKARQIFVFRFLHSLVAAAAGLLPVTPFPSHSSGFTVVRAC